MRKVVLTAFTSLDGVMQAPGGPDEDRSGGFRHGGWVVPTFDQAVGQAMDEAFAEPFDLLLGRRTYDIFAAHWPRPEAMQGEDAEIARLFNAAAKHVATHRPESLDWHNSHGLGADAVAGVRMLKDGDGPALMVQGSTDLLRQLFAHDLVDELRLLIHPLVLGGGKRLFADGTPPAALRLVDSRSSPSGVLIAHYRRAGDVATGSFALEDSADAAAPPARAAP